MFLRFAQLRFGFAAQWNIHAPADGLITARIQRLDDRQTDMCRVGESVEIGERRGDFRADAAHPMPWSHVFLGKDSKDPILQAVNLSTIPRPILVGPDGKIVDAAMVDALSKIPGKDQLRAMLLMLFKEPATRLARVLSEKAKKGGDAPAAPAPEASAPEAPVA